MILLNKPVAPNLKKLMGYLEKVHQNAWYTNFGPLHQELTERLEEYLGVKNLLLVSNGTLAIQVACKALGVRSALTTPFSFVATSSSMLWKKMDIAFCDIDKDSLNLCVSAINKVSMQNDHYDAVVATHVYGNPSDVEGFDSIATDFGKKIIYDAAQSFGVKIKDQSVLSFGDASTLSFHATKVFHTVEGGAVVFRHRSDFDHAKELINFGIQEGGKLGEPGINAKLNEYQSAVGLTLLDDIEQIIEHRASLFELYRSELKNVIDMPLWHSKASINGAYMPICCESPQLLRHLILELTANNIQSKKYFSPSLDLAYNDKKNYGCEISNNVSKRMLSLPLHYYMTMDDVKKVVGVIKKSL